MDNGEGYMSDLPSVWTSRGYIFTLHEHRGHGRSDGLWAYISNLDVLVDDASYVFQQIRLQLNRTFNYLNQTNCFLAAESMGGAITIKLSLKEPDKWRGMILIAPMCEIDKDFAPSKFEIFLLKKIILPMAPKAKIVDTPDLENFYPVFLKYKKKLLIHQLHTEINQEL